MTRRLVKILPLEYNQKEFLKMVTAQQIDASQFTWLLHTGAPIVVFFRTEWDGPSKMISPKFEDLSNRYPELKFVIIDADQELELAESIGVEGFPSFGGFRNGQKVILKLGARESLIQEVIQALR